jgi:hypothetical protein
MMSAYSPYRVLLSLFFKLHMKHVWCALGFGWCQDACTQTEARGESIVNVAGKYAAYMIPNSACSECNFSLNPKVI